MIDEKNIQKAINKFNPDYSSWDRDLCRNFNINLSLKDFSVDESKESLLTANDVYFKVIDIIRDYCKFKDEIALDNLDLLVPCGHTIYTASEKTDTVIEIGQEYQYLVLFMRLENTSFIKFMPDKFWDMILELSNLGDTKFEEGGSVPYHINKVKKHNAKKSILYKVFQSFAACEFNGVYNEDNFPEFGSFETRWEYSGRIKDILPKICRAYKLLYKINYMLWKEKDLKMKRK